MDYKMEELLPIVTKLARKYAGWESTSITYESAQTLMEGVLYCLEEYQNQSSHAPVPRDISLEEQYAAGARLVLTKTSHIREMFNTLSDSFQDYGVKCLGDTVRLGIPAFLRRYDARFCPQDTILTMDYPVLADLRLRRGADAVYHYLRAICAEQRFLGKFDGGYVREILGKYDSMYEDLYENICEIVLMNLLGHMALHKPLQDTGFGEGEYARLTERLRGRPPEETAKALSRSIEEAVRSSWDNDAELLEYLCADAPNMAARLSLAAANGRLDRIFLL